MLALHALAWRVAAGGLARLAPAPAGVHRMALVSVPQRAVPAPALPGPAPDAVRMPPAPVVAAERNPTPPRAPERERDRVTPGTRAPAGAGGTRRRAQAASRD